MNASEIMKLHALKGDSPLGRFEVMAEIYIYGGEEAQEAFTEYSASVCYLSGWAAPYWLIEEYAIEECHYDEDGDRICDPGDGDYHDLKTLVFDVYEIDEDDFPVGDRLARFDSYAEAEAWAKANGNDELRLEVVF